MQLLNQRCQMMNQSIQQYLMNKLILIAVSIAVLVISVSTVNCNATHFDFTSKYSLGKQDQINRTFVKVQEKIPILSTNVSYNSSSTRMFTIYNIKPIFYYIDSKQKASVQGNDTILIDGGFLQVDLTFNWTSKGLTSIEGFGSAQGLSEQVIEAKKLVVDTGFYTYELLAAFPITWSTNGTFRLTRIDPATTSQEDQAIILAMITFIEGNKDVRTQLQNSIAQYYEFYLKSSLRDQNMPVDKHFNYIWIPTTSARQNITIPFSRRPINVDIEKQGIQMTFQVQVQNDSNWKCGTRLIPSINLDVKLFGGIQQFISFDLYQGVLRYAIDKKILDTQLNKQNWESSMFQFYAGDLYDIFPLVQSRYSATQVVDGLCSATVKNLRVENQSIDTFNAYLHYDCELLIEKQKIIDFGVDLKLTVGGHPNATALNFKLRSHNQTIGFYPYGEYKMQNKELGQSMIKSSLNRLYQGHLFGSGWPTSPPKDYPHFHVDTNYTILYDSSHVESFLTS